MSDAQNTVTNTVMLCAKVTRCTLAHYQNMEGRRNKVPVQTMISFRNDWWWIGGKAVGAGENIVVLI